MNEVNRVVAFTYRILESKIDSGMIAPRDQLSDVLGQLSTEELEEVLKIAVGSQDDDDLGGEIVILTMRIIELERGGKAGRLISDDEVLAAGNWFVAMVIQELSAREGILTYGKPVSIFDDGLCVEYNEELMSQCKDEAQEGRLAKTHEERVAFARKLSRKLKRVRETKGGS